MSKKEVEKKLKDNKEFVIRLKVPKDKKVICDDLLRGNIEFDSNGLDDQVLIKSDGFPTYHFAVVVDDYLMKISHVIRSVEWLPSFPKHVLIYEALAIKKPVFVHTPSILNKDSKGKLSKRHGHSSVDSYKMEGFLPEAIINFLALLGWSHPDGKDIFTYKEFVEKFDIKDIKTSLPRFDIEKLTWMNGEYIRGLQDKEFVERLDEWKNFIDSINYNIPDASTNISGAKLSNLKVDIEVFDRNFWSQLNQDNKLLFASINKERIKKFSDILDLNRFFYDFSRKVPKDKLYKFKNEEEVRRHLKWFNSELEKIDSWTLESLKKLEIIVKNRAGFLGWRVIEVFHPIRVAITKSDISPPLFESIYIFGRKNVISNLNKVLN